MLGRTASSLFWMSRYVERAENVARLLDAGRRMNTLPGSAEALANRRFERSQLFRKAHVGLKVAMVDRAKLPGQLADFRGDALSGRAS